MAYAEIVSFYSNAKNIVRELAVKDATGTTGLFLPSSEGLCVQYAMRNTTLETIICCERDHNKMCELVIGMTDWHKRTRQTAKMWFHHGNVQDLDVNCLWLDYMFLDLCGTMSSTIAAWLSRFRSCETEIAITLNQSWRASAYMAKVCSVLADESLFVSKVQSKFNAPFWRMSEDGLVQEEAISRHALVQAAMLHTIFANCGLEFICGISYRGVSGHGAPMAMFRFRTNPRRRGLREATRIDDLIQQELRSLDEQDPALVAKAYQCYKKGKKSKLKNYWQQASNGQRAALSRRCGKSLSKILNV